MQRGISFRQCVLLKLNDCRCRILRTKQVKVWKHGRFFSVRKVISKLGINYKKDTHHPVCVFFGVRPRFEDINAARTSAAREGLTERHNTVCEPGFSDVPVSSALRYVESREGNTGIHYINKRTSGWMSFFYLRLRRLCCFRRLRRLRLLAGPDHMLCALLENKIVIVFIQNIR